MARPLHLHARNNGVAPGLYKVLGIAEALEKRFPLNRVLVDLRTGPVIDVSSLAAFGIAGAVCNEPIDHDLPQLRELVQGDLLGPGDAVRVHGSGQVNILFRRGANANTLFVTERCNSLCLMCSQPPRDVDDGWRVDELMDLLPLLDADLDVLGVTGGEPTLLGSDLVRLLKAARILLPGTHLHVLTNGRAFRNREFTDQFDELQGQVTWAVPLYGDVARVHDFVVQSDGAFDETMHGLHHLGERRHRIEIRTVLHGQTLPRIDQLARYVYRNLPFADHIALMGIEPMGLARKNMALLDSDLSALSPTIAPAVNLLHQAGMNVSIYNMPLCTLAPALRPFARKSISDWKNEYAPACESCVAKPECCGFFKSASSTWRDAVAQPIGGIAA
ncbi:His-Xaa-Ser system radical SAM maturase HxsC [Bradyrhizobium elkanii]|uniref:His-Xaa-Ser system radical SAM maturase HxsC n=1 Tax=Bradyrhizobium TaxID=374 RepID=UPI002168A002|nr:MULTISPECIES: His-Xaa-Ser system radical SAM maturase HxsC [Bradyrhizobium]MCS3929002.1 His-Xaa-Ser system radical SAM maturase HxsC [Bradyrhizobium elkanii]MCS3969558.1 His-Xaa-Ser system radical SAM maturase HxsC [Bradyrhizobium japonicum]